MSKFKYSSFSSSSPFSSSKKGGGFDTEPPLDPNVNTYFEQIKIVCEQYAPNQQDNIKFLQATKGGYKFQVSRLGAYTTPSIKKRFKDFYPNTELRIVVPDDESFESRVYYFTLSQRDEQLKPTTMSTFAKKRWIKSIVIGSVLFAVFVVGGGFFAHKQFPQTFPWSPVS